MKTLFENSIRTSRRNDFYNITQNVAGAISESGINDGICIVFVPHTTAGVTINENADPDVKNDITNHLGKMISADPHFAHSEGNSDSHIKSSLIGASLSIIVSGGKPLLGTWQGIYFAEFDGPRSRKYFVKCIAG